MLELWEGADKKGKRYFPHEYFYQLLAAACSTEYYQIDPKDSWLLAAAEKNLPIFVPGWEDSTLGNIFVAARRCAATVELPACVKSRPRVHGRLIDWYKETRRRTTRIGFFQIGGGIAGDFPICVVPLIQQDLQAGRAVSGATSARSPTAPRRTARTAARVPNEKITWGKLARRHAALRHRVRRHDRGAADLRLPARLVAACGRRAPQRALARPRAPCRRGSKRRVAGAAHCACTGGGDLAGGARRAPASARGAAPW